jgi:hypothetical protein
MILPSLLQHPTIPKPLHGLNPRTIKGQSWWDSQRKKAYAKYDYRCWACGVHKLDAKIHRWLEGHEYYDIDYDKGRSLFIDVVALCPACHSFIHNGRLLSMVDQGQVGIHSARTVISHGMEVLESNGLKPTQHAMYVKYILEGKSHTIATILSMSDKSLIRTPQSTVPWDKWHLEFDGKKYYSRFANLQEWAKEYGVPIENV